MKYYFVIDDTGEHICVAANEANARKLAAMPEDVEGKCYLYELREDTFTKEGWLISKNK